MDKTYYTNYALPNKGWKKLWVFKGHALNAYGLIFAKVYRYENYIHNNNDFLNFSAKYLAANKDKPYPNGMLIKHALIRLAFRDKGENV
jgi:hypothetical protein